MIGSLRGPGPLKGGFVTAHHLPAFLGEFYELQAAREVFRFDTLLNVSDCEHPQSRLNLLALCKAILTAQVSLR